jgi:hypothetical protein
MPVGIGERLSDVAARERRANPRSPGRTKWPGPSAGDRRGLRRQIVVARGRPGETSGLGLALSRLAVEVRTNRVERAASDHVAL